MITRRRLFALPGVSLAALPQAPWEQHREPKPPPDNAELYRLHLVTNARIDSHGWALWAHWKEIRWLKHYVPGNSWKRPEGARSRT